MIHQTAQLKVNVIETKEQAQGDPYGTRIGPVRNYFGMYHSSLWPRLIASGGGIHAGRKYGNVQRTHLGSDFFDCGTDKGIECVCRPLSRQSDPDNVVHRTLGVSMGLLSCRQFVGIMDTPRMRPFFLDTRRVVDVISNQQGIRMPPVYLLAAVGSTIFLLISGDWWGEIRGAVAIAIPLILYILRERARQKRNSQMEQLQTTDSYLKLTGDRERRLEERESRLREDEREFFLQQLAISRSRSHVLAGGYMAMELACDRLIEVLREHEIEIPNEIMAQRTRGRVLNQLQVLEEKEVNLHNTDPQKGH